MALRTITGKVEDIAFKLSENGNEFCVISFIEKKKNGGWNKYPYNCRTFDEEIVEALKEEVEESETGLKGVEGELRVEVKQDREYQGKTVTDRDIVDYNFTGLAMDWERTQGQEDAVQPPAPSAGATYTGGGDPRQASIERQVAFKEAIAMVHRMGIEQEVAWWDALNYATNIGETILNRTYGRENLAEKLNEWLELIGQGAIPKKDENPDEADQKELF